jgi:hypothetical protein
MDSAKQSYFRAPDDGVAAAEELRNITATAARGRQLAAAVWFPLLLWGIADIASPTATDRITNAFSGISDGSAPFWYWCSVSLVIVLSCTIFYRRRPVHPPRPIAVVSLGTTLAIVAVAVLVGVIAGTTGGPELIVGVGLLVFARMYRSRLIGIVAVAHLAAGAAIIASSSGTVSDVSFLAVGTISCVCALVAVASIERSTCNLR